MKLEPTEAQRKAIIGFLSRPYPHYDPYKPDYEGWLDAFLAAANSIPEGPPVDTIARRPDGAWIAWRTEDGWGYRFIGDEEPNEWPPGSNIADSWPVIYDPTSEKTREEKIQDYLEWSETQVDTDALDPIAQQEPGESLSRGLDDLAAGRVSRRDDYLEPQPEPKLCSGCYQCQAPKPPRTPRVVDRLGVDEQRSRWRGSMLSIEYHHDGTTWWGGAFAYPDWVNPTLGAPFTEILEPRVLPSLECEEARDGTVWEARYVLLAGCREQTPGWKFQHTQDGWVYEDGSRVLSPEFLTGRGPYTEVFPDVG